MDTPPLLPTREQLIHALYEAAELEHNLMCTYLYAAFSLKDETEGLNADEAEAVKRWRRAIIDVAVEEMGHLAAVWNITSAVGGTPRFGRVNFPIDPGYLPAGIVVKLAPFSEDVLQHFVYLERPHGSDEPEGKGFESLKFSRDPTRPRLTPMGFDYNTVGDFYEMMQTALDIMSERIGDKELFCGDPALQLSPAEVDLRGAKQVLCTKTAKQACLAIVAEGEGASEESPNTHFCRFRHIRDEYKTLKAKNPQFEPAHPAATNVVLRRPPNPEGRVWIQDEAAAAVVDVANASYQTMLRLLAYSYEVPSPSAEKGLAVDLAVDLMKATTLLGESAARRPSGSKDGCNAGMSFTALRDSAPLPRGPGARRFFIERMNELSKGAQRLDQDDHRVARAAGLIKALCARTAKFADMTDDPAPAKAPQASSAPAPSKQPPQHIENGVEIVEGEKVTIHYRGKLCIHSRFCVTGAPKVFLANVEGPWIHPDDMDAEELMAVARECPSGAIQYRRNDGGREEQPPPVNLIRTLEAGPYTFRSDLRIDGEPIGFRATLCRCGASKNKPFCDGSHHEIGFSASGEPPTGENTAMLEVRDGPIEIAPQLDGPLMVRGNMEIIASTGRVVARTKAARFCRCGHSNTKPFCDGTHAKIGFKST